MLETTAAEEVRSDQTKNQGSTPPERGSLKIGTLTLSNEFATVVQALGEIQAGINAAGLVAESTNTELQNPYASLPAILKALSPHLKAAGVTLLQPYEVDDCDARVTTIFLKGQQYASMSATIKADNPYAHAIGSAITYCCRYSIRAMLGLAVEGPGDKDDDGNLAAGKASPAAAESAGSSAVSGNSVSAKSTEENGAGYSEALRGYLKRVETADLAGLTSAEAQVPAFKLVKKEQDILLKAIRERKEVLTPPPANA